MYDTDAEWPETACFSGGNMFVRANNIRVGMVIEYNGDPHKVMTSTHITPGKGNAVVQTKLRNLMTGVQTENRYRATEDVKRVVVDSQEMEYLYADADSFVFMNTETYEQTSIHEDTLGNDKQFLTENIKVLIQFVEGRVVGVELPKLVELTVVECPPGIKGATATNSPKPATLENDMVLNVPNFINPGDKIRVDTIENKYVERVKE
jgi:elongation factor P